jgi:hypothetical protein
MGLRSVLQLFVYLISEGFSHSGFIFNISNFRKAFT